MPLKFREIIAQKLQSKKYQLDRAPNTGTVQNYLDRYGIFSSGLKMLNNELVEESKKFIEHATENESEKSVLNEELKSITNDAIHNYIKYFKGNGKR